MHRHTLKCAYIQKKGIFISWSSLHRIFLSLVLAALFFLPQHSHPLPSWRLGSAGGQRKPLSWWKNHHSNLAWSPAPKRLAMLGFWSSPKWSNMRAFFAVQSVVTLSNISSLGGPIPLASVHFGELDFLFSPPVQKFWMPIYFCIR